MPFRTIRSTLESDRVFLVAHDIAGGPWARIRRPFRVPAGVHGDGMRSADLPR